jgi:hypothetical protein
VRAWSERPDNYCNGSNWWRAEGQDGDIIACALRTINYNHPSVSARAITASATIQITYISFCFCGKAREPSVACHSRWFVRWLVDQCLRENVRVSGKKRCTSPSISSLVAARRLPICLAKVLSNSDALFEWTGKVFASRIVCRKLLARICLFTDERV